MTLPEVYLYIIFPFSAAATALIIWGIGAARKRRLTMSTRFKAYITKYAMTNGIEEIEAEDCFEISTTMISAVDGPHKCYHGNDWHRSREMAVKHAEEMRLAKIDSLKKSIAKLEKLRF